MASDTLQIQTVLYNMDHKSLTRALDSLANAVRVDRECGARFEHITMVHGDASPKRSYTQEEVDQITKKYAPWFEYSYIYFDENTGTSRGHNRMFETCTSDYLIVQNPDIQYSPMFLQRMREPFDRTDVKVGLSEARQVPMEHPKEYDEETKITPWATGACFMTPSQVYKEVGGFDADLFFMYCDDVDLSWRIRLAGYELIYQPLAPVFHPKQLGSHGEWRPTSAEIFFSAEAELFMCYKFSYDKRLERLISDFKKREEPEFAKAAETFLERKQNGQLPKQLDPAHRVAEISDKGYAQCRYGL